MPGREPSPFFEAPSPPTSARRLLLMSYHFPPDTGAGALRWQKLAGHLAEHGWVLDVVTQEPAALTAAEPDRLDDLPPGTRVWGVPAPRLRLDRADEWLARLYRRVRPAATGAVGAATGAVNGAPPAPAAPGAGDRFAREQVRRWSRLVREPRTAYTALLALHRENGWAERAGTLAARIADARRHTAIVTCGPPHMVHEAGRRLAAATGLPHVLDMRDPWSLVQRLPERLASPAWYRVAERFERRAVEGAALVVCNTEPACEALQRRYPGRAGRMITVRNGCDEEAMPEPPAGERFVLAYAGTIYLDRDPRLLLRAVGRVAAELQLTPAEIGVELMGTVAHYGGAALPALAEAEGAGGYVRLHPRGTRAQALRFLSRAAMLVSLPQDSDMAIPSKVFEYMQFRAWLLALAEARSATGRLLAGSRADLVRPGDTEGLVRVIRQRYREFRGGARPEPLAREPRFSRAVQARRLVAALGSMLDGANHPREDRQLAGAGGAAAGGAPAAGAPATP